MNVEIFKYIIDNGECTIPQIASETGLSIPTVTKYLAELQDEGYVDTGGSQSGHRGRKATIYTAGKNSAFFLGVDIKHFSIVLQLVDIVGNAVQKKEVTDFLFENTPAALDRIVTEILSFIRESGALATRVRTACVNISGRVNTHAGHSYSIFRFEGDETPLADILSERTGIKTIIHNDTQAMTYGEYRTGSAGNWDNILFLNISWGLGMGIILNGKPYYGSNGYAGELGHIYAFDNEIMCHCGKKGCLETEASISAMVRKIESRIRKGENSVLSRLVKNGDAITPEAIRSAVEKEDPICLEIIEEMGINLGRQVANLINVFNPQAIIVGGTLADISDDILLPIKMTVNRYALKLICRNVEIVKAALGSDSGVTGACLLARDAFISAL